MKVFSSVLLICALIVCTVIEQSASQDFVFPDEDYGGYYEDGGYYRPPQYPTYGRPNRNPYRPVRQTTPSEAAPAPNAPPATPPPTDAPSPPAATPPTRAFLRCISGCRSTNEYNPVCGSDGQVYHNLQRLNCANRCGADPPVVMDRRGACEPLGRPTFSNF